MKSFIRLIVLLSLSLALNAQALTLSLVPEQPQINSGYALRMNINVEGLNNQSAPSLGAYDLTLDFNSDLLNLTGIYWGDSALGNQLDIAGFGSLQDVINSALDTHTRNLNLFELSFDSAEYLDQQQAGNFTLLSLLFASSNTGVADFSLQINSLSDAWGNALVANVLNTSVTVKDGSTATVPEPSAWLLLMSGLIVFCFRQRKIR